jgi:hypothetical protein
MTIDSKISLPDVIMLQCILAMKIESFLRRTSRNKLEYICIIQKHFKYAQLNTATRYLRPDVERIAKS